MRRNSYVLLLCSALTAGVPAAQAQRSYDVNIGFGTQHVGASGGGLDNVNSTTAFNPCIPGSPDLNCVTTPGLGGFFLGFAGDVMLKRSLGFGAEVNFQPGRHDFGPLVYRETFWDINAIYAPIHESRFRLRLQGGLGEAHTGFAVTANSCVLATACAAGLNAPGAVNHFQLHGAIGFDIFVMHHITIRPQFDLRYVPNLNNQFGGNTVPGGEVWVGYTFGEHS